MNVLITGGTGFIGCALQRALRSKGDSLIILSREPGPVDDESRYIRSLDQIPDTERLDAIINLAGASLAGRRWSPAYKAEIVASRIDITGAVIALCARLEHPPSALLSASAIGYYGPGNDEKMDETFPAGKGFSANLCADWENETMAAQALGIRVCLLRLGVVLDSDGGAMAEMVRPFRFGIANWIGTGRQWLSWVHRADAVAAIEWLLQAPGVSGAVNVTAPAPVTSRGFCDAMKCRTRTFITLAMPAWVMRLIVGEMADELLITGQRVVPTLLQDQGFSFRFPTIDDALDDIVS
ncbi:MAG: TIGR01777 family oxidoreductase [Halioglobus sp.]